MGVLVPIFCFCISIVIPNSVFSNLHDEHWDNVGRICITEVVNFALTLLFHYPSMLLYVFIDYCVFLLLSVCCYKKIVFAYFSISLFCFVCFCGFIALSAMM